VLENKTNSSANAASYLAGVRFVEEWQIELPNQGIHLKNINSWWKERWACKEHAKCSEDYEMF
jgi:hypothetical protein